MPIEDSSWGTINVPKLDIWYNICPPQILYTGIEGWIVFLSDFLVFHSLSKAPTLSVFYNKLKGELCLHDISVITVLHYHYVGWGIGQNPPKTKSTWQIPPETKSPKHESGTKPLIIIIGGFCLRGFLTQGAFIPGGFFLF